MGIKVNGERIDSETVEKLNIIDGEVYVNDCRLGIDGLDNDSVDDLVDDLGRRVINIVVEGEICGSITVDFCDNVEVKGSVFGDITAGGSVNCCGHVTGHVEACESVRCGDVGRDVKASKTVYCDGVGGDVSSEEGNVVCGGDVAGNIIAGGSVVCNCSVDGNVSANGNIVCDDVYGKIDAGESVCCRDVSGDISADGNVVFG